MTLADSDDNNKYIEFGKCINTFCASTLSYHIFPSDVCLYLIFSMVTEIYITADSPLVIPFSPSLRTTITPFFLQPMIFSAHHNSILRLSILWGHVFHFMHLINSYSPWHGRKHIVVMMKCSGFVVRLLGFRTEGPS